MRPLASLAPTGAGRTRRWVSCDGCSAARRHRRPRDRHLDFAQAARLRRVDRRPRSHLQTGRDRRGPLAPGCKKVIQGPPLEVVGESFHRDAIEGFLGRSPDGHSAIVDAVHALEPSNPFDPHAVAVSVGGRVVGYRAKADAAAWRPVLAWYAERGITPVARGDVLGGLAEERWDVGRLRYHPPRRQSRHAGGAAGLGQGRLTGLQSTVQAAA